MKSFTQLRPAVIATAILVAAITPCLTQATPLEDLRNLWKEWSKVKGTISEEKNVWAREQQSIADAIAVSRQEVELLTSRLTELNSGTTGTEKQRSELLDKIAASKTSLAVFAAAIEKYESKMRELVPVIPPQLRTELSSLLQRMPTEGKPTAMPVSQAATLVRKSYWTNSIRLMPRERAMNKAEKPRLRILSLNSSASSLSTSVKLADAASTWSACALYFCLPWGPCL